ncbi:hypothetical protein Tco_0464229 [Tanacetum coccineum]
MTRRFNTLYPEASIRHIERRLMNILEYYNQDLRSQEGPDNLLQEMDDPDITIEEYIQLEAEKAHRRGQTFNWETATYGKVGHFEYIDYFKDFETEFPAIVYNDALTFKT